MRGDSKLDWHERSLQDNRKNYGASSGFDYMLLSPYPLTASKYNGSIDGISTRQSNSAKESSGDGGNTDYRSELWKMADALRGAMDAAEYKHVVLGLIFLKYISDAIEEAYAQLEKEVVDGADPEDPDEYRAQNIFWVPQEARWPSLQSQARQPTIGRAVDDAMTAIERDNPALKDILPEQRTIAHVLGTLDDKIELVRRMNETLKEMAQTLFKSWFVDFDPVRAKMEGHWRHGGSLSGLLADLYDLFPNRLVASEFGKIPERREVKALGEVAKQRRNGVRPEHNSPDTPYIALEYMPKRCIALGEWSSADGLSSSKFRFERGDILFGKLRPYFHKVGIVPLDGVCSTDIIVMSPRGDSWFGFVLGRVSSSAFVDYTDAASTGTKMPRTKWADMAQYKVVLPDTAVDKAFNAMIKSSVTSILSAAHESRSLTAQRDALLPGLVLVVVDRESRGRTA